MAPRTTSELIDITKRPEKSFPVGSMIEVVYDMPELDRKTTYLGTVAVRPEEKAKQTVVTNKYGDERIIQVAATYTLKTIAKSIHYYIATDDGLEIIESNNCRYVADLVFDPSHPAFSITPAPEIAPEQRI